MIDGHIHYADTLKAERIEAIIRRYGLKGIGLLCIPAGERAAETDAFALQSVCSVPVHIFGGIPRTIYQLPEALMGTGLVEAVQDWMRLGRTGLKTLDGETPVR